MPLLNIRGFFLQSLCGAAEVNEVINKMRLLEQNFENASQIIADKGSAFRSNEFKEYCEDQTIHLHLITLECPRGNGQVERINDIIEITFAKIVIEELKKWCKYMRRVQLCINRSFQRSVGTMQYKLLFGTKLGTSEDVKVLELLEEGRHIEFESTRNYLLIKAAEGIA